MKEGWIYTYVCVCVSLQHLRPSPPHTSVIAYVGEHSLSCHPQILPHHPTSKVVSMSQFSTMWPKAICCALKFDTPIIMSNNTFEMSSIFMYRGFIMIFQMKATFLTSNPVDLRGITHVWFEFHYSFLHMENNVPWRLTPKCFFMQKCAQWWPCCKMLMWVNLTWFPNSHLPKFCLLHLPLVHIINKVVVMQKFKLVFPLSFMQYPTIPKKYTNPQFLVSYKKNMPHRWICIPSQPTFIFLFRTC